MRQALQLSAALFFTVCLPACLTAAYYPPQSSGGGSSMAYAGMGAVGGAAMGAMAMSGAWVGGL